MSEQNTEVARRAFEAFNAGDVEGLVEASHPDSEWLPFRAQLEGETYRGHDGVRRFFYDMQEDWREFQIELVELREVGGRVVVVGHIEGLGRGSGVAVSSDAGFVMDFRGGRIVRVVSYSDPEEARREAAA
jgi:ketosteroid isomerase-like protein